MRSKFELKAAYLWFNVIIKLGPMRSHPSNSLSFIVRVSGHPTLCLSAYGHLPF